MAPAIAGNERRPHRVSGEHRIFSLILALVASPQGLTKHELLSTVHGYAQRYEHGSTDPSLEKQFERDKQQLRELGIPLETVDSPTAPGDNRWIRYRISKQRLQFSESIQFTPREIAVLRLAALAWADGSLTSESRRSAIKIEALGAGLDIQHLGIAPRLGSTHGAAPNLRLAIEERRIVRFRYQMPGYDAPSDRRVAPLGLHRSEARWHLLAHDLERSADRVFLLSRIVGPVTVENAQYEASLVANAAIMKMDLARLRSERRATVDARAGSVAEARLAGRSDSVEPEGTVVRFELGTLDYHELAVELAGYGDQVSVRRPLQLRDDVIARLTAVRHQHSDEGSNTGGDFQ